MVGHFFVFLATLRWKISFHVFLCVRMLSDFEELELVRGSRAENGMREEFQS